MMVLLSLLAVGMLALSTIQLRSSGAGQAQTQARANARLALQQAIGQLQVELGPDQRVCAPADLLEGESDIHWTGVWSSTNPDNESWWSRDPDTGSWVDRRVEADWSAKENARAWLVSGGARPGTSPSARIDLVAEGSVGDEVDARVSAPLVEITGDHPGAMAWWTGDLSQRADVALYDPHAAGGETRARYGLVTGRGNSPELIGEGLDVGDSERARFVSSRSVDLAAGTAWPRRHFHDFTIHSRAVQANVLDGGLKRDLSSWFESDGSVPGYRGLPGIDDETPMLAQLDGAGLRPAGPTMGLLRDWASSAVTWTGNDVATVSPETVEDPDSEDYALANENPARLSDTRRANLQPILVEASNYMQISTFETVPQDPEDDVAYQLRHHIYPRVVLWNPYNVELEFEPAILMIQGNGRQEMWTTNNFGQRLAWISFEGGRSTNFADGSLAALLASDDYHDPYMGSYYFSVPKTTFGPGECLVFSPARSAEYDALSTYRPGPYDLAANELSCEVSPDPSRSFYVSGSDIGGGVEHQPTQYWYAPTPFWWLGLWGGIENQADDTRVVMKQLGDARPIVFGTAEATEGYGGDSQYSPDHHFDNLPQLSYLSGSLQFGAGKEPRIAWDDQSRMDIELLDRLNPRATLPPDVRTRQGLRLRWFEEHRSNLVNAGPMSGNEAFFQEALFATWNPRASYAVRNPWENLAGSLPTRGSNSSGGGPWFFGAYTRDLYDEAVGWDAQTPRFQNGRYHGNPFGPPQEGLDRHILFELPRRETGILSLGQLQSAKLSELVWHPSFAFGNSLADPRLGYDGLDRTVPPSRDDDDYGGFDPNAIGWSSDGERSDNRDAWAKQGRALLQGLPGERQLVYDLSYEVNHALWDAYFVSGGDRRQKSAFLADPAAQPLPNGRMILAGTAPSDPAELDFHRAARHLMVEGAFNVNSTRVEAWKAVLAATRDDDESSPFRRLLAADREVTNGSAGLSDEAWNGFRSLSDEEIERLAEAIVEQVKLRGPFLSMSDFVNRRLHNDETGRKGALQAAIDASGLNQAFVDALPIENDESLEDYVHPDNIEDPTRLEQTLKPGTMAWGAPGFLTQGDLLQVLAPSITVRSDSFVIRAYGDARDPQGNILARAWCEAVVQRTPEPLEPGPDGLNPKPRTPGDTEFGRRFEVVSFRWLKAEEV
ncbi:hypothetical protein MLD59_15215 [Verrucomicrobiaceae bacterium E54]|nr:hypothetical protein [Verrucomicrobiaceae bacterium E54]